MRLIGVISDTHGLLHPRVRDAFSRVDHIVHAGDVGGDDVLAALEEIAPVTAVLGNNDAATGEDVIRIRLGDLRILLTHILPRPHKLGRYVRESLAEEPADMVVFGHSHLPHDEVIDGVRFFNPASAGPRRFDYPISVGLFEKKGRRWSAAHVALDDRSVMALKTRMNQLSRRTS